MSFNNSSNSDQTAQSNPAQSGFANRLAILTIDTETASLHGDVYDLAYAIHDKRGNIAVQRNWLVNENFTDAKRMMGAYYASKLFSHYAPMLDRQEIHLTDWSEIVDTMRADIAQHGVNVVAAYNLPFDVRVIRQTNDALGDGMPIFGRNIGVKPVFGKIVKLLDIWQFICESRLDNNLYRSVAMEQGWISKAGNVKTGAEFAYRYTFGDHSFIEDHTALSDVLIEIELLTACFKTRKKIPYNILDGQAWRIVNKNAGHDTDIHGGVSR